MIRKVLVNGPEKVPKATYMRSVLKMIYASSYFRDGWGPKNGKPLTSIFVGFLLHKKIFWTK